MNLFSADPTRTEATVIDTPRVACEDCQSRRDEGERGEQRWCLDHRYTVGGWRRPTRTY